MGANTPLNLMSGGDLARDIDLGGLVKIQVVMPVDPALLKTYRGVYSSVAANAQIIAGVAAHRMVVVRFKAKSDPACPNIPLYAGFGSPTPTNDQVVYSHPNLPPGVPDGDYGYLGVGADGEGLFLTTGVITGGALECNVTYLFVPTAGI